MRIIAGWSLAFAFFYTPVSLSAIAADDSVEIQRLVRDRDFNSREFSPTRVTSQLVEFELSDRDFALQIYSSARPNYSPRGHLAHAVLAQPLWMSPNAKMVVWKRQNMESVVEFLLRHQIFKIRPEDLAQVSLTDGPWSTGHDSNVFSIWQAFYELSHVIPDVAISPFDLFVVYDGPEKLEVKSVIFQPALKRSPNDPNPQSLQQMMRYFAEVASEALKTGVVPNQTVGFSEAQLLKDFIKRRTQAGEMLTIVGVTQEFDELFSATVQDWLKWHGYELVEGYYFGSRVMPRSTVLERQPEMASNIQAKVGQLVKNEVRESGVLDRSDLEFFLVVRPLKIENGMARNMSPEDRDQQQKFLHDEIGPYLSTQSRRFPFAPGILIIDDDSELDNYFVEIQKHLMSLRGWEVSPHQYARFYPKPIFEQSGRSCGRYLLGGSSRSN